MQLEKQTCFQNVCFSLWLLVQYHQLIKGKCGVKKIIGIGLGLCLLCGCQAQPQRYSDQRYDLFDTLIVLTAYCDNRAELDAMSALVFGEFERLHGLFDIYGAADKGLARLNAMAGQGPQTMEPEVLQLLALGKEGYALTDGKVNIAMGAVLQLWSAAREAALDDPENAALPDAAALREAAQHCDIADLALDEQAGTAELRDSRMCIDAGAVAKGFATGLVADALRQAGYTDFVISAGGNVWAEGAPPGAEGWGVGVMSPDESGRLLTTMTVTDCAVVTSGGYLRYFSVNGVRYHHIIDPETLMPSDAVLSATVVCGDSGMADVLSTACFMLPENESAALIQKVGGARLLVLNKDGELVEVP